jgi:DNA mismatch repair ATPase MutS
MAEYNCFPPAAIVVAVQLRADKLGISVRTADNKLLIAASDAYDPDFSLSTRALASITPDLVLVNDRVSSPAYMRALDDWARQDAAYLASNGEAEPEEGLVTTAIVGAHSSDFDSKEARSRLLRLASSNSSLPLPRMLAKQDVMAAPLSLGCAGALLKRISDSPVSIGVLEIPSIMGVSASTLAALDVIPRASQFCTPKSSLSSRVNCILNLYRTSTSDGRKLLRRWFIMPLADMNAISRRHDCVELLTMPRNSQIATMLKRCLATIKPMRIILNKVTLSINDWVSVHQVWPDSQKQKKKHDIYFSFCFAFYLKF